VAAHPKTHKRTLSNIAEQLLLGQQGSLAGATHSTFTTITSINSSSRHVGGTFTAAAVAAAGGGSGIAPGYTGMHSGIGALGRAPSLQGWVAGAQSVPNEVQTLGFSRGAALAAVPESGAAAAGGGAGVGLKPVFRQLPLGLGPTPFGPEQGRAPAAAVSGAAGGGGSGISGAAAGGVGSVGASSSVLQGVKPSANVTPHHSGSGSGALWSTTGQAAAAEAAAGGGGGEEEETVVAVPGGTTVAAQDAADQGGVESSSSSSRAEAVLHLRSHLCYHLQASLVYDAEVRI
jgi:hypothetical protein